ncbi:MAG: cobalt ECF transporter T component CbiQ [Clostridium sp.]
MDLEDFQLREREKMKSINSNVNSSKIINLRAEDKLIVTLITTVLTLSLNNMGVSIITIIMLTCLNLYVSGISPLKYMKIIGIPIVFLVFSVIGIMIEVNSSGYIHFISLGGVDIGLTMNGLINGTATFLRSLGCFSSLLFFVLNTRIEDIIYLLKKVKVPMLLINLMEMIYRFVFILYESVHSIYIAGVSRGGADSFKGKIKLMGLSLSRGLILGISRAYRIDYSIRSRGYYGEINYLVGNREFSLKILILGIAMGIIQVIFYLI